MHFFVLDLKVIIDFVPNHSSDESPWFDNSCNYNKTNPDDTYKDFYVWKNKAEVKASYKNWVIYHFIWISSEYTSVYLFYIVSQYNDV